MHEKRQLDERKIAAEVVVTLVSTSIKLVEFGSRDPAKRDALGCWATTRYPPKLT